MIHFQVNNRPTWHALVVEKYPNGEPRMAGNAAMTETITHIRFCAGADPIHEFMSLLFYVDALKERGFPTPILVMPFAIGSRQDRVNPTGDFLFTAKSIAREINSRGFPRVIIADPHSEVITGLINRTVIIDVGAIFAGFRQDNYYHGVISPDAGADKRAAMAAKHFKIPLLRAWKTRDVTTGKLSGFGTEPLEAGAHYLVVDDLCDGGGTFVGLGAEIGRQGAKADLYVTHGYFTKGVDLLRPFYNKIYTTDSLDVPLNGVYRMTAIPANILSHYTLRTPSVTL